MQNVGLKISILGKFWGNIKILSTHYLLCRKFAAVCRKIATFCPAYFLTHDSAVGRLRDVKASRPVWPQGQIIRPRPRPRCIWPRPHRSWPRGLRNLQPTWIS